MASQPAPPPAGVYTLSAHRPFLDVLAESLLLETGGRPESLIDIQVLLPTRRACRALRDAFLRRSGGRPLLLPRMRPLGDVDEDDLALEGGEEAFEAAHDAPPAISGVRRRCLLAKEILRVPDMTADNALRLAGELAKLIDQAATERRDLADLKDLVPADWGIAEHWRATLTFLQILTRTWPEILEREGAVDPATRRDLLMTAEARDLAASRPGARIVAAGSTGSIPATAELLGVIARLPSGAVILPGLDTSLDAGTISALPESHPQFGLCRLLSCLEKEPAAVDEWRPELLCGQNAPAARARLLAAALRPGGAAAPTPPPGTVKPALAGVRRIDCASDAEEAAVIALMMREVLETPGKTAALVTPDRRLARRVASALRRWRVEVDDSAGAPFARTRPGMFLRLTAAMVSKDFAPAALLSVLKHPLASGGMETAVFRRVVRGLERTPSGRSGVLRGYRLKPGLAPIQDALAERDAPDALIALMDWLAERVEPFRLAANARAVPLADLVEAHIYFAEALAATDTETGDTRLWVGGAGDAGRQLIQEIRDGAAALGEIEGRSYPAVLDVLMAGRAVRPRHGAHPRLAIWGLMEARLQRADRVILGGLNEGGWPPEAEPSPWMSRPMLQKFGLPPPERRIGLTAHDFVQGLGACEALLTRSSRTEGAPTVPARWLLRLESWLASQGKADALAVDPLPAQWRALLDKPEAVQPVPAPAPKPPIALRPSKLAATRIETWRRDPYAIFGRYVLGLKALEPLEADLDARERGNLFHNALENFIERTKDSKPFPPLEDALRLALDAGDREFAKWADRPEVMAFWRPRFRRAARWFVEQEIKRRGDGYRPWLLEVDGRREITRLDQAPFIVTAKADRIDKTPDGGLDIIDYKTGQPPSSKEVGRFLNPQLPIEAAIAAEGGFDGQDGPAAPDSLTYIQLTGARKLGETKRVSKTRGETAALADETWSRLTRWVHQFENPGTPYRSRLRVKRKDIEGDYDHLARVKEWSSGGEDGDGADDDGGDGE